MGNYVRKADRERLVGMESGQSGQEIKTPDQMEFIWNYRPMIICSISLAERAVSLEPGAGSGRGVDILFTITDPGDVLDGYELDLNKEEQVQISGM